MTATVYASVAEEWWSTLGAVVGSVAPAGEEELDAMDLVLLPRAPGLK